MTKQELIEEMRQAIIGMGNSAINCQYVAERYAKQKAIAFANWKDSYMNNPPIGELASNEQLFDIFNSGVQKGGVEETFSKLREIGTGWDNVKCVCRGLMRDNPCEINCKEFHDENLSNEINSEVHKEEQK